MDFIQRQPHIPHPPRIQTIKLSIPIPITITTITDITTITSMTPMTSNSISSISTSRTCHRRITSGFRGTRRTNENPMGYPTRRRACCRN